MAIAMIVLLVGTVAISHFGAIETLGGGETPTRLACAPRPTRTPDPHPTNTRDPHPKSPTIAPSRTPGPPQPPRTGVPPPTLVQKLDTVENALNYLMSIEIRAGTIWDDPWCLETLKYDPERIQVKWYLAPGHDAEGNTFGNTRGPTVVISIKGWVNLGGLRGPGRFSTDRTNGVTFEFGRDTGELWRTSSSVSDKSGAKDLPDQVTIAPTKTPPKLLRTPRLRRGTVTPVQMTREP